MEMGIHQLCFPLYLRTKRTAMDVITLPEVQNFLSTQPFIFAATQRKLCFPILMRIYKKMRNGIQFTGIRTSENLIIDGHHRYVAALLAEIELDITPTQKTSATEAVAWKEVEIDTQDWDTPAKILMLNELDAKNNQLSLEAISKMLE